MFDPVTAVFVLTGLVGLGLIYSSFLLMRSSVSRASLQAIRGEIDLSVAEWKATGRYPDLHLFFDPDRNTAFYAAILSARRRRLLLMPAIAGGMLVLTSISGLAYQSATQSATTSADLAHPYHRPSREPC
jgi:hypothetical protein